MGEIRQAKDHDLEEILELGKEFGHLMEYQKSSEGLEPHLGNILVYDNGGVIEAYYHCQPVMGNHTIKFVVETKVFPRMLEEWLKWRIHEVGAVGVCMQGAGHREPFRQLIQYLQQQYDELWCWTSIKSVGRTDSYGQLGFSFNPKVQYTFPNPHKGGGESTYQLGVWTRERQESIV